MLTIGANSTHVLGRSMDVGPHDIAPNPLAHEFGHILGFVDRYGATFQFATALDQGGKRGEARPWWEKALKMAEASHDKGNAAAARARLAEQP